MAISQLLLAAKAALSDVLITADGTVTGLTVNKYGRLRVSTKPGQFDLITGNLQASGGIVAADINEASTVVLTMKNTGATAMAVGTFQYEASLDSTNGQDGTWFQVLLARSNANTQEFSTAVTTSIAAGGSLGFALDGSISGFKWFRVRVTADATVGSIASWTIARSSSPADPNPVIPTHAVTQSGTFTVAGSGTFSVAPAVASNFSYVSTATAVALNVKSSAASVGELSIFNGSAATVYVKIYNKASAPALATDVPVIVIPVAAGAHVAFEYGSTGKRLSVGYSIGITGAASLTDATAVAAGVLISSTYV